MSDFKTISQEKPWMKYFSEESRKAEFPRMKVYSYFKEVNRSRLQDTALYYYGAKISVKKMILKIDHVADALDAIGVKKGDTVSMVSASTPESIYTFYALNKIGATLNAIDPRLDHSGNALLIKTGVDSIKCCTDLVQRIECID